MKEEKKTITDSIDKFFKRPRSLEVEHDGEKMKFLVAPLTMDGQVEYLKLIQGGLETAKDAVNFIFAECLRDESGARIWEKAEDVNLAPIAKNVLFEKVMRKAVGNDLTDFEIKN